MRQMKIYAEPELAEAFKGLCVAGGTSVTAELCEYMRKRTHSKQPATLTGDLTDRRWQRKAATHRAISLLEKIRDAEESYRERIPENLSGGPMAKVQEL
jgi:ABC-type glutathione transport system ATPase component